MLRLFFVLILLMGSACAAEVKEAKTCKIGGCSSQLCVDANAGEILSTCEWTEAYACYPKHGICEVQENGECGWTKNPAFDACIANSNKANIQ